MQLILQLRLVNFHRLQVKICGLLVDRSRQYTSGLQVSDRFETCCNLFETGLSSFFTENLLLLPSSHHVLAHKNLFGTRADVRPVPEELVS